MNASPTDAPPQPAASDAVSGKGQDLPSESDATAPSEHLDPHFIEVEKFNFWYGDTQALFDINMEIPERQVSALIGPSGCGKSTLLRNMNRMNDLIDGIRHEGDIRLDGTSLYDPNVEVISLRKRVGMVFQKSNPFPKSIYENVIFSLRVAGRNKKSELDEVVERSLHGAALWDEVKDRLNESAFGLLGGQMQRLCIARAIANRPQILLMDEPCAALDPLATLKIEELIQELKKEFTIVIVTHNMQQAVRCSDRTAFFYLGKLIEYDSTLTIFENPSEDQTEAYIGGLHKGTLDRFPEFPTIVLSANAQPVGHVLEDALGKGIVLLEDHPHLLPDVDGIHVDGVDIVTVNLDRAPGYPGSVDHVIHPVQTAKQGGLAAPGRADERGHFPLRNMQGDVHQCLGLAQIVAEAQVIDLDDRGVVRLRELTVRFSDGRGKTGGVLSDVRSFRGLAGRG